MDVLADADGPLLTIHHFIVSVVTLDPIHDIKRKVTPDGMNDFISLLILVDKFPLKCRTHIQPAAICYNAVFCVVDITLSNLTDRDFM